MSNAERRRQLACHVLLPLVLLAGAAASLPIDFALSHWAVAGYCPRIFRNLFDIAEPFGNGLGVLFVALAVVSLDPLRRRMVPRLLTAAYGAGLAANLGKMLIERTRPCRFDFAGTIWDSFGTFLPLVSAGSGGQSLPSAHTATAVGLAGALIWLYPRGRLYFAALAALVAAQRVIGGAHFLSDVFGGAALGCVVASLTLRYGKLPAWFARFEESGNRQHLAETRSEASEPGYQHRAA